MNKELLERVIDNLFCMVNYANDGVISRNDENYKKFFEDIDKANELLEELNILLEDLKNKESEN